MKTVVFELAGFLLLCILGTAAGGFIIMLYDGCTAFVAGNGINVFSVQAFVDGMLIFFPVLLLFVPMFLYLSLVRHTSKSKVFGIITVSLLSMATWIFCVPPCFKAAHSRNVFYQRKSAPLSVGFFRRLEGGVYYFTNVSENHYSGIRIRNEYFSSGAGTDAVDFLAGETKNFGRDYYGFSDPLVGENLTPPKVIQNFLRAIFTIQENAFQASKGGPVQWLFFSSIMAAILSVGAVLSASEWKLASAFYVLFDTILILVLNFLCLSHFAFPIKKTLADMGGIFVFVQTHLQFIANCVVVFVLCLAGTLKAIVHSAKKNRGGK